MVKLFKLLCIVVYILHCVSLQCRDRVIVVKNTPCMTVAIAACVLVRLGDNRRLVVQAFKVECA